MVYHGTLARRLGLDIAIMAVAEARESYTAHGTAHHRGRRGTEPAYSSCATRLDLHDVVTFSDGFVPVERIPA